MTSPSTSMLSARKYRTLLMIVLDIGLDLRVLPPSLFAIMVIMALVTTFATTPLSTLLGHGAAARSDSLQRVCSVST